MQNRLAVLVIGTAIFGTSGCSFLQGIFAESIGVSLENKAVAYKSGSQELVATDGTYCFVSRGKFEEVEVGDHVQCTWSSEPRRDTHGT
jgi:hypothetical protein